MEFDERELRREISFAIKNIHGVRYRKRLELREIVLFMLGGIDVGVPKFHLHIPQLHLHIPNYTFTSLNYTV